MVFFLNYSTFTTKDPGPDPEPDPDPGPELGPKPGSATLVLGFYGFMVYFMEFFIHLSSRSNQSLVVVLILMFISLGGLSMTSL